MKVCKRANLGENWAVRADGGSDQSIAQIFNLTCQSDCNQLMSTEWPTGNEMILERELIWVAIATRSWRRSSKIKKPRAWTCQNMWMNKGDHYNCRMRIVNQSLQAKMMQIHWIETATSLRQKVLRFGPSRKSTNGSGTEIPEFDVWRYDMKKMDCATQLIQLIREGGKLLWQITFSLFEKH